MSYPSWRRTASCVATKNASRSWCVTMIELTFSRSRSLIISSSTVDRRDRIETGGRLVVQQDARLGRHCAGDRDAATLTARELGRHAVDVLRPDQRTRALPEPAPELVERHIRLFVQLVADVFRDRQRIEQRALLEHHPDVGAHLHQLQLVHRVDALAVYRDRAAIRFQQSPRMSFRIVDLPEPLAPRITFVCPGSSVKLTSFNTTLSSKASDTLSHRRPIRLVAA